MTHYYLGIPVEIVNAPNEKGYFADPRSGYVNARWPDGKVWTHWRAQLMETPYGKTSQSVAASSTWLIPRSPTPQRAHVVGAGASSKAREQASGATATASTRAETA